jgi:hypothetical protein
MPKISLNRKYRKRDTSFIDSNIDANNSKFRNKTNIGGDDSNSILTILKPSFPSTLMIDDLIKNNTNNKPKSFPNAFIAYRMALMKEYRIKNRKFPSMREISKIAKNSWNMEPKHVKNFYELLVKDAKSTYKKNNIQIVLDRHMNYVENNQESGATYNAIVNENLQVQKSVSAENSSNEVSFSSVSSTDISIDISTSIDTSYGMNSTLNEREYIRMLEQIIDHLIGI